jgi:hypothetical protein
VIKRAGGWAAKQCAKVPRQTASPSTRELTIARPPNARTSTRVRAKKRGCTVDMWTIPSTSNARTADNALHASSLLPQVGDCSLSRFFGSPAGAWADVFGAPLEEAALKEVALEAPLGKGFGFGAAFLSK